MLRSPVSILLILFLTACVTINIYFPAAAAEQAADEIIDKVYKGEQSPEDSQPAEEPTATTPWSKSFNLALTVLVANVQAEANLDIATPKIQALSDRMAERHKKMLPFYNQGAIGLTHDGLIRLRKPNSVPLNQRQQVKQWVEAENQDRLTLYREIAQANGHPEWRAQIQATFAKRWIDKAQSGWWYQNEKGNWQQR